VVRFGSNPERVPGGHNRWGYGDETAYWRERGVEVPCLEQSLFEGFMRRSNEESLSEVTAKGEADRGMNARGFGVCETRRLQARDSRGVGLS
jgi:hypothetical protein